jgi:uncharacterized protein YpmS
MKWLKRLAIALGVILVLAAAVAVMVFRLSGREPDWYAQAITPPGQHAQAAEQNLIKMQNWVTQTTSGPFDAKPDAQKQYTVELSDQQINALIAKWSEAAGIGPKVNEQMRDIRVRLADGKITVAGRLVEQDRVLSVVLLPKEAPDGYTKIALDSLRAGDVPLPLVTVEGQRQALANKLKVDPNKLGIDSRNYATRETAGVYYLSLLTDLLAGESPDLYGFLQYQQLGPGGIVATRVRTLRVGDGKLAMTVELLPPEQRKALIDQLTALAGKKPNDQ